MTLRIERPTSSPPAAIPAALEVAPAARAWPVRWVVMLVITYAVTGIVAIRPTTDPDVWWHLQTATWITEHKTVPFTDPFSLYGMNRPWIAYSWLFELILLGLYRLFGLIGVIGYAVLGTLGIAVALHSLIARYEKNVPRALALTIFGVAAMSQVFWPRSYLISIFFFTVELHVLFSVRDSGRTRPLLLLPPLLALWANFHIQFVYGLIVIGIAATEPVLEHLLPQTWVEPRTRVGARPLWAVFAACIAMSLATPYHVWIYRPLLDHVTHTETFYLINELQALQFRNPADWCVLGTTLAAAFTLGRLRTFRLFPLLLLAAGVLVSFRAQRDVWFVVVVSLVIIASGQRFHAMPRYRLSAGELAMAMLSVTCIVVGFAVIKGVSPHALADRVPREYPAVAAAAVEERRYAGPLYNHYNWGGYLIWALPRLPVSIDGRANVYGPEKIRRSVETWAGLRGWDSDPDLARAGVVIAPRQLTLSELLRRDPRFELTYEDDVAALFVARR